MPETLKIGDITTLHGLEWRHTHRTTNGDYCFVALDTGNVLQIPEIALPIAPEPPEVIKDRQPNKKEAKRRSMAERALARDISSFPEEHIAEAERRRGYVERILRAGTPAKMSLSWPIIIGEHAQSTGDRRQPAWQTVRVWYKQFAAGNYDVRSLIPLFSERGLQEPGSHRSDEEKEFLQNILNLYLSPSQPTAAFVVHQVQRAYDNAYETNPVAKSWKKPSRADIYRQLRLMDPYEIEKARLGKRYADRKYKPVHRGRPVIRPLEIVQIDHFMADVIVYDDDTGEEMGNPSITVGIDQRTRMVVGLYIATSLNTADAASRCLRNIIEDKSSMISRCPDVKIGWNPTGIPERILVDNDQVYKNDAFLKSCEALQIVVEKTPRFSPESKGVIERFKRTMKEGAVGWMPGKIRQSKNNVSDEPGDRARITFKEFQRFVVTWLILDHCYAIHRSLQDVPARLWNELIAIYPPRQPDSAYALDMSISLLNNATLSRAGIVFKGLNYNSDDLAMLLRLPEMRKSREIGFRVNPEDLGYIQAVHPATGGLLKVPAVDRDYAAGLTLERHLLVQAFKRKRSEACQKDPGLVKSRALFAAAQREVIHSASVAGKIRRSRLADQEVRVAADQAETLVNSPQYDADLVAAARSTSKPSRSTRTKRAGRSSAA